MKTNFTELIFKSLEGGITKDEEKLLNTWLSSNDSHQTRYDEIKAIWDTSEQISYKDLEHKVDVDLAYSKVLSRVSNRTQDRNAIGSWVMKIAASLLLFAMIGGVVYYNNTVLNFKTITAQNGNQQLILPDNSVVWLEKNSTLKYYKNFGKKRDLQLTGKALFEVTHNPKNPFVVNTDNLDVTVLGTQFIVSSGQASNPFVQVIEGKVRVNNKSLAGDHVVLTKDMIVKKNNRKELDLIDYVDSNDMFWATKKLAYDDHPMTDVLKDLEKYYKVDLDFTVSDFTNCTFSGGFHKETIENIFSKLSLIYSLESSRIDDKTFLIKAKPCN